MQEETTIANWEQGFFLHHRLGSALKRVEYVTSTVQYIVLRGHWHNIIVFNVRAPIENNNDDSKDSFYEELEQIFNLFPKYRMKIQLGYCNEKLEREDIFKPTIGMRVDIRIVMIMVLGE